MLSSNVFGNPHSRSHSSQRTTKFIDKARHQVLSLFNTTVQDYEVIFTQNTTQAVKLVAEGLQSSYGNSWKYAYSEDSHTSLIGLRELASSHTTFTAKTFRDNMSRQTSGTEPLLVSWPAQSNFSGERFLDKSWHGLAKKASSSVFTLVDVAGLSSTCTLDLSNSAENPLAADFLCLSFYKLFGFPDLGALLVKKTSNAASLFSNRKYFGGGTVESLTVETRFAPKKALLSSQLEDGTIPFHSIIALSLAIDTHLALFQSFDCISRHTSLLSDYCYRQLKSLKYSNGQSLCEIYSTGNYIDSQSQGPIVSFNIRDVGGAWIGYAKFDEICSVEQINVRTGTMCNTGGASRWIGYSEGDIIANHQVGHICGDTMDVLQSKPTGAIRVSFGAMSSIEDFDALVLCLQKYFLDAAPQLDLTSVTTPEPAFIKNILVYPIKSCGAFLVPTSTQWTLLPSGLQWDREFCVVSTLTGNILSLKKHPEMANIKPFLDLDKMCMEVAYEGNSHPSLKTKCVIIPLVSTQDATRPCHEMVSRLCGERIKTSPLESPEIMDFFSTILQVPCTLARSATNDRFYKPSLDGPLDFSTTSSTSVEEKKIAISMNNSSPLLLLSEKSVAALNEYRDEGATRQISSAVFRGNIIIDGQGLAPYAEDGWQDIRIGSTATYNVCA